MTKLDELDGFLTELRAIAPHDFAESLSPTPGKHIRMIENFALVMAFACNLYTKDT